MFLLLHTPSRNSDTMPLLVNASHIKQVRPTAAGYSYIQFVGEQDEIRVEESFATIVEAMKPKEVL